LPARRCAVAEVGRRRLASNKLGIHAPKRAVGRVNGGLARSEGRRVKPSAGASSERYSRESASPLRRERTGARPRVARDRHSAAFPSSKAVSGSWDRGCNGHRILGRVPADGRHPGSSRSVSFHEKASTVILAAALILRPVLSDQKKDVRPSCSLREDGRGARVNSGRDRGVRGSVASSAVGRKRPRS